MRRLPVALAALLTLCGAGVVRADDDKDENIPVRGANGAPLEFRLIPVAAFNPSITVSNTGTDQLKADANNHLSVLNNRTVQIEFQPVVTQPPSPLTYRIWFCRFGAVVAPDGANSGCVALLDPASTATPKAPLDLTVNASGVAKGVAVFPALAANAPAGSDVWAGSFVVTRAVTVNSVAVPAMVEFVSAFEFLAAPEEPKPPVQAEDGVEVELKGEVADLKQSENSFQLAGVAAFKVVCNGSTRFIGRYKSIEELSNGMEVDVRGTFVKNSDNTFYVLAERVRAGRED